MADFPPNIPTDDAIDFQNSEGDTVSQGTAPWDSFDDGDTEDPTGKGRKKIHPSSVFSWKAPGTPVVKRTVRGGNNKPKDAVRYTPGGRCLDVN